MRDSVALWLGKIGDVRAVEPLIVALNDEFPYVRLQAALALAGYGDTRAVLPLISALKNESWMEQDKAVAALDRIDPNWRKSEATKAIVSTLLADLHDRNRHVRYQAAETLGKIADDQVVDALEAVLGDEDREVRTAATRALERIGGPLAKEALRHFAERPPAELRDFIRQARELEQRVAQSLPMAERAKSFRCGICGKLLEEIGVPPQIQFVQMYKQVVNIGTESVPAEIKADPYLYRGLYCPSCNQVFCPTCAGMQLVTCPRCHRDGLMPGYRPLLRRIAA